MQSPNDMLLQKLKSYPKVRVQNVLMNIPDRQIALGMMFMQDGDRAFVMSRLPSAKSKRIREELALHERLRISYDQYKSAVRSIVELLEGNRGSSPTKSYLRPISRRS